MIDPDNENKGLGTSAMHYVEQLDFNRKIDSFRLDCFAENKRANKFYRKVDYVKKGETMFRKGLFNLYEKLA